MDKHVVIIDDSKDITDMVEMMLGTWKIPIEVHNQYDLVPDPDKTLAFILDYHCPPTNGGDWLKKYQDIIPPERRILLSGDDGWKGSGFVGHFLYKPFRVKEMYDILIDLEENDKQK